MDIIRFVLILLLPFVLSSCTSNYGSTQLPPDRISYNASLQYSDNQQMLINMVRLRYTDTPYFLTVNSVVSQFSLSRHIGVQATNDPLSTSLTLGVSGDGSVDLSEFPTITYTPYQGESYVTKLLTPIDLSVVYMLMRAGWGVNAVLRLTVQRIGPYENAALASRSVTRRLPKYQEFHGLGLIFLQLQHENHLSIKGKKIGDQFAIELTVEDFNRLTRQEKSKLAKYGLTPSSPSLLLVNHPTQEKGQVYTQTRTVLGVLNYLSKGVDVPLDDIIAKRAPMTYRENGQIFDWRTVTKGEMSIHNCKTKPENAYVAVYYRKNWFYIAEEDFDSKETLSILSIIMGIYQGEVKGFLPVFTVS